MMRAGTDQEGEEQWCRGLSQPPKEYITRIHYITSIHHMSQPPKQYITWIFYITRTHHMSQPPKDKDIGKEGIILELI